MTIEKLLKVLDNHGIDYSIKDNRVIAPEWYIPGTDTVGYTDVTDFEMPQLKEWLGY